ncbi:MAG: methyltransferase domain-containing protein [Bacteroidales bacterium]|jgi:ubiquinone/menaquinone biosynthesis C-methylase UbiE|nr:methyltransferase domain-containing protein [Bacteroidales bacterium]
MGREISSDAGIIRQVIGFCRSGSSSSRYYEAMNSALYQIDDQYTMLHYPLHMEADESFRKAQENLTRHCLSFIEPLEGKTILEIGCGNGVQTKFIAQNYNPGYITGIDLNRRNILIANREKERRKIGNSFFLVDDAQKLRKIADNSFQVVVNIESAFHYPDKQAFLSEIYRVLEPGGRFIIADIIRNRKLTDGKSGHWTRNMGLNHWTADQYGEGLAKAGLKVDEVDNITEHIIKGYRNYRSYFRHMKKKGLISTVFFRLFYLVNVKLNIRLLEKHRQYIIYSGSKPAEI